MKIYIFIFLQFLLICQPKKLYVSHGEPFSKKAPNPQYRPHVKHPQEPSPVWGSLKAPYPTTGWFQNFIVQSGTQTINLFPFMIKLFNNGVQFTVPREIVSSRVNVRTDMIPDWTMSSKESLQKYEIVKYDDLSVTVNYGSKEQGITYPFVQGMPYFTGFFTNITPTLNSINAVLKVIDRQGKQYQPGEMTVPSDKFVIFCNSNAFWVVYLSEKQVVQVLGTGIGFQKAFTGWVRVSTTGKKDTTQFLDKYYQKIPIGGNISYETDEKDGVWKYQMEFQYGTIGKGNLLMMGLPHHQANIKNVQVKDIAINTVKGMAIGYEGEKLVFEDQMKTFGFYAPNGIDNDKKDAIKKSLEADQNFRPNVSIDPYWFGLDLGKAARLALIADELNEKEIALKLRQTLKETLGTWLKGKNPNQLQYDTTYGGICSKNGLQDRGADYGNGWYNDHHFHYGYFIYAAAVIAKEDKAFFEENKDEILDQLRDYANPSIEDPYFTVTRCKDWYAGHSWAMGLFEAGDNRNQESTSEAINAYYAVTLLGLATKNDYITNFGRLLLLTEIRSTQTYWHMPSKSNVYPEIFKQNKMVGIVWSTKADYATWFGDNPMYIHGIQMIPFTPITELSLDKEFIQEEYPVVEKAQGYDATWKCYLLCAQSIIDKSAAWTSMMSVTEFHPGASKTNTLYFIATRP